MHFFHFSDTCYLGSSDSTKFLESTVVLDSFVEGCTNTDSRMLWNNPKYKDTTVHLWKYAYSLLSSLSGSYTSMEICLFSSQ
jgi:hypothetical protein